MNRARRESQTSTSPPTFSQSLKQTPDPIPPSFPLLLLLQLPSIRPSVLVIFTEQTRSDSIPRVLPSTCLLGGSPAAAHPSFRSLLWACGHFRSRLGGPVRFFRPFSQPPLFLELPLTMVVSGLISPGQVMVFSHFWASGSLILVHYWWSFAISRWLILPWASRVHVGLRQWLIVGTPPFYDLYYLYERSFVYWSEISL